MLRPIYGVGNTTTNGCICIPDPPFTVALIKLRTILGKLRSVIEKFYNPFFGISQVIGKMSMSARVSTVVFIRLKWIETNPDVKFDKTNPTHLDDIRFIYNILNKDWHTDPLFNQQVSAS